MEGRDGAKRGCPVVGRSVDNGGEGLKELDLERLESWWWAVA